MKTTIYIIVDTSGSMNEMGKIHLQRNLCRFASQLQLVDQVKYSDIDTRFFQWSADVSEIIVKNDEDVPALSPKGSSDFNSLAAFLSGLLGNSQMLRVLILSDGNFSNSDISSFQKQLTVSPDILLQTVAIGSDADLLKLKKISSNESVYLAENISAAIDSTILGTNKREITPSSASQIKQTQPPEPVEDWDV